jgi:diguanylate cyclase (GGDEF)-like protein/PAS domain S-box-containing protein
MDDQTTGKAASTGSEEQFQRLFRKHSAIMLLLDPDTGEIFDANRAAAAFYGYPEEVLRTMRISQINVLPIEEIRHEMQQAMLEKRNYFIFKHRRADGEIRVVEIHSSAIDVRDRTLLFSIVFDITEKKEAEAVIWRQAHFDALTGLPNRAMFQDRLEHAIKKAERNHTRIGLLFLDLDYFKEVNDTLGHGMGDKLLLLAAQRLRHCVRDSDTVVRLGGDEFIVIVDELTATVDIERVVQSILHDLSEPFLLGSEQVFISASIGITFYPEDGREADVLLKNADQAMYAAKGQGRNRYSYFTASMQEVAQARKRLVSDLRTALAENQFRVFYQPIVELATGVIRKAEALVRWQHPARGLINPVEFIPVAEQTGMVVDIGEWVFRTAAHQAAAWRAKYHPQFQVAVNVSPVQFHNDGIDLAAWLLFLQELGLPGQSVVVEITEGLLMDARQEIIDQLLQFRDNGVQVALDDFGTGYSSLSYLKKFDIDYIKIDRSFVSNLAPGSDDLALCEAIIVMTHKLGMKVVAEGVETEAQRDLLAASGCDYAQGFLFSVPVPAEELERLL